VAGKKLNSLKTHGCLCENLCISIKASIIQRHTHRVRCPTVWEEMKCNLMLSTGGALSLHSYNINTCLTLNIVRHVVLHLFCRENTQRKTPAEVTTSTSAPTDFITCLPEHSSWYSVFFIKANSSVLQSSVVVQQRLTTPRWVTTLHWMTCFSITMKLATDIYFETIPRTNTHDSGMKNKPKQMHLICSYLSNYNYQ